MDYSIDCLVIGGGPAGLTAAIYLGRFRRSVMVIDKGWSRVEWIRRSHNLPGFPAGIPGPELLNALRTQARSYGAVIETGIVDDLAQGDDQAFVADAGKISIYARTVILATGVTENKPPVPHVAEAVKSGLIRTCPICDGYESRGRTIGILGDGEHAASEALYLRTYSDSISLLLMATDTTVLSAQTRQKLQAASIGVSHVVVGSVTLDETGVTALSVEDNRIHRFDLIYSAFGTTSQTALAAGLGARMDADNRLIVDAHQATSVSGLYAAGDVVRGLNQISVAEGEAAIAATAIHNLLPQVQY